MVRTAMPRKRAKVAPQSTAAAKEEGRQTTPANAVVVEAGGDGAGRKGHKPKLVRHDFTIPRDEYRAIDALKGRAAAFALRPKKSELLRAGLMLLQQLPDAKLAAALKQVPAIKTGRPKGKPARSSESAATSSDGKASN